MVEFDHGDCYSKQHLGTLVEQGIPYPQNSLQIKSNGHYYFYK